MKTHYYLLLLLFLVPYSLSAQSYVPHKNDTRISKQPVITIQNYSFPLEDITLLQGSPFYTAAQKGEAWLLSLDPDRFLYRFFLNAQLTPKATGGYEGWEGSTQSGFCFGHWLSATSMCYASNKNINVLNKVDYAITELRKCQVARGTGYVGGIRAGWDNPGFEDEDQMWDDLAAGNFVQEGTSHRLNGTWVPWYNLHKLWAGLVDVYLYTGNETAKTIVTELTDWAYKKFENLTDAQWQTMLHTEFGGMNDALYNVYAITGKATHLELAKRFYHKSGLDPLAAQQDKLSGLHANTIVPKITGAARAYELTGNTVDKTIATYFWDIVVHDHSYCTGGNSNHEHFSTPRKLELSGSTTETCNTYNMLKLTRHLFSWNGKTEYMDYYERALYNHILASQNPTNGMVTYFVPLANNSKKSFCSRDGDFWCCVGTGFENHIKYGEQIYTYGNDESLYVNLFIPSQLDWKAKSYTVKQETTFPDSDKTTLTFTTKSPKAFKVHLRYPAWATAGYTVKVNGQTQNLGTAKPGSYVVIERTWASGDKLEIEFPKTLHLEALLGHDSKKAILNGPIVLAAEMETGQTTPLFLDEGNGLDKWIKKRGTVANQFKTEGGLPKDVNLLPFYKKYEGSYSVYFDIFAPSEWDRVKEEYEAEQEYQKLLERITLDEFRPNEQQSETDHNLKGDKIDRGNGELGKKWIVANNGGWYSFDMKVDPQVANELILTHWGSDSGNRRFDILIDEEKISYDHVDGRKPNEFYDAKHAIPYHLTKGKSKVTVKLQAQSGNQAGGIFGARTVLNKEMIEQSAVQDYLQAREPYLAQHNFSSNGSSAEHRGHYWADGRDATGLSFDMKCSATDANYLILTYWGGESDLRRFDVMANGVKVGSEELLNNKPGEFFDVLYVIPTDVTQGKTTVRVHLKGSNTKVGGFFYAYTFSRPKGLSLDRPNREALSVYSSDSALWLKNVSSQQLQGTVNLYTLNGTKVFSDQVSFDDRVRLNPNLTKGIYIVHFRAKDSAKDYIVRTII